MGELEQHRVSRQVETYLDHNGHSETSLLRVIEILDKFEYMVNLATNRALEELSVPQTLDPEQPMGIVIPLRREHSHPRDFGGPAPA